MQAVTTPPAPVAPATNSVESAPAPAVERAFQLGWSLAELKGRVAIEPLQWAPADAPPPPSLMDAPMLTDPLDKDLWRGSMWRIGFDRVSLLHASFSFRDVPAGALYDPGENQPPLLFPAPPTPDYASSGALWPDDPAHQILPAFRLRETTRRVLNSLDLLYLNSALTLQVDVVAAKQAALLQQLGTPGSSPQPASRTDGILHLTQLTLTMLDTWDAYLREQFADVGWSRDSENNLVAYEAGRALASLSWNLTRRLLALGRVAASSAASQSSVGGVSMDPMEAAWIEAFNDRDVSYVQHMLAVLAQALDAETKTDPPASTTIKTVIRSIELWQRSVEWLCGKRTTGSAAGAGTSTPQVVDDDLRVALVEQASIWQALVLQQEDLTSYTAPGVTQRLLLEATIEVERAIDPQQLGQIGAKTVEISGQVLGDIDAAVHKALDQVVTDASTAVDQAAHSFFKQLWPWIAGLVALLAIMFAAVVFVNPSSGLAVLVNGIGAMLVTGLAGLHITRVSQQQSDQAVQFTQKVQASVATARDITTTKLQDARSTVANAATSAGTELRPSAVADVDGAAPVLAGLSSRAGALLQYVEATGEKALANMQAEVQDTVAELERVMAISYPLIDYVVARSPQIQGGASQNAHADSAYNFLTMVIWTPDDRKQELLQVASAAFGPLGVIALASTWGEQQAATHAQPSTAVPEALQLSSHG
jgi:hypothetical protein